MLKYYLILYTINIIKMKIYKCESCDKIFKQKSHYDKHVNNKKKPCKFAVIQNNIPSINPPKPSDLEFTTLQKPPSSFNLELLILKTLQKHSENIINPTNNTINTNININNDKGVIYECDFCEKIFTRQDNLQRHLKNRCKHKKGNDENKILITKLLEEMNDLKKHIITNNTTNNTTNNSMNNSINNSNNKTTNNIQNNNVQVNINGWGKEDLNKLNILDAMKVYLKSTGGNIIANMLKYINLNCNYPENHNICISDLSREIVKMHNGKKFIYKKFKNAKYDIVDKVVDNIYEIVNKYKDGNYKKSLDINSKLNINEISLKLISGEELENEDEDEDEDENENENEEETNADDDCSRNTQDIVNDLNNMDENIRKMIERREKESKIKKKQSNIEHLNSKREGLQQITFEKIKEELYNGKNMLDVN